MLTPEPGNVGSMLHSLREAIRLHTQEPGTVRTMIGALTQRFIDTRRDSVVVDQ